MEWKFNWMTKVYAPSYLQMATTEVTSNGELSSYIVRNCTIVK